MGRSKKNHRPPPPDRRQKDGDIVIQVTLRTLSGRRLAFTTFRMRKNDDCALGSLGAICNPFEELDGHDYSYLLLLDGRTINCRGNSDHNILEYAEHFRTIPIEDALDAEYKANDLVFHLDLQQIVQAPQLNRRPPGHTLQQDTRLTEWRRRERVYKCDRCAAVKAYEGRILGFDGTYLDETWRVRYEFADLKAAWQGGKVDITWWCRECIAAHPTKRQKN